MTTKGRWAILVEGVGLDASLTGATAWGHGEKLGGSVRDWRDSMAEPPRSIDSTVNPATGEFSMSSFVFQMHGRDVEAETFLFQQTRPQDVLQENINASATSINLSREDLAGQIVYLGMETIRLLSHSGAGVYSCIRGRHDSVATPHESGRNVYTKIPKWRGRGVTLFQHEGGAETITWRGLIDSIATSEDGTRILVRCRELWSTLMGTRVNRGADAVQGHELSVVEFGEGAYEDGAGVRTLSGTFVAQPTARKRSRYTTDASPSHHFWQVGDAVYVCRSGDTPDVGLRWRPVSEVSAFERPRPLFGSEGKDLLSGEEQREVTMPVYEMFVVSRAIDQALFDQSLLTASATRDYPYPYHPLTIVMALLFGTELDGSDVAKYNTATTRWSMNIGSLFAADILSTVADLIAATREIEVDFFALGWDGEEVDIIREIITRLLRPYGFFLGVTKDGKLTFAQFSLSDVVAYDAAIGNQLTALTGPLQIGYDSAQGSAIDIVEARVGERPWKKGRNVTLQAQGGDADRARLGDNHRWTIDYSTIDPENAGAAVSRVIALSSMGLFALPRITIRVDDLGQDLDHGSLCTIADLPIKEAYLVDNTGSRIASLDDRSEYAGIVVGRRFLVGPRTYEITLLFTNFRGGLARLRPPSLDVISVSGSTVTCSASSQYGALGSDSQEFNAGDQVVFYDPDDFNQIDATVYVIGSIGATSVTMTASLSPLVAPGSVMELAAYSDYAHRPFVANSTLLAYNYMAVSGVLGDSDEPHIYGGP